jgi:hypothetical protein
VSAEGAAGRAGTPGGTRRPAAGREQAWLQDAARLLTEAGHAPECRACPVCRGITVLRQLGPDLLDQVARVATDLAATLREQADQDRQQDSRHDRQEGQAPPAGRTPDAAPPWWGRPPGAGEIPRTERIDITD